MGRMEHVVTPEFLCQIGHIAVSFAVLEDVIDSFAFALINEPQRVCRAITAELPFKNLRALLVSPFIEKNGRTEDFARLKALLNRAGKAEEERNRVFHSGWGIDEENMQLVYRSRETAKEKHGLRGEGKEYTIGDLKKVGDDMLQLATEFEELREELQTRNLLQDPFEK
ncbi:MAG: hypothetical protein ISR63_02320 [Desulfobacterales bacterium]|nr:hypothetical protein [Desulfobacterales bacterium]